MAGDPITAIARRLCAKFPDAPSTQLARRLVRETKGALTPEQARSRIRRQFGLNGTQDRKTVKPVAARAPRTSGVVYKMPASVAPSWTPYVFPVVGTIGVLSDVHVPYHSERAVTAAVEYLKEIGVDGLVLNGDICDFYAISRYMKDPAQRDFKGELTACREFVAWIRQEFPSIPIVFKTGNHEERWQHWLWQHAPEVSDDPVMSLGAWLRLGDHDIELVEDKRPIMCGKLPVLHGHEKGTGISAPVNQARGAFMRLHHTVLEGHGHRTSSHCEPDMFGKEVFCWSTGCLAELHPEYNRFAKYNWGFAVIDVEKDGGFGVQNLRISDKGKVRPS